MGFSITWCAVHEEEAQKLLDHLGLLPTGETEEFPESAISMASLDTGWRVIWFNRYASPFLKRQNLSAVSNEFDVLVCRVEEHVMASSAEFWSGGKRRWWIAHDGEDGPKGLEFDGALPESFPRVRSEMEAAQLAEGGEDAEVDYIFDIPLKVSQSLAGFKHDEECPHLSGDGFTILSHPGSKKGWLGRLFGR